jgi:Rad3-related DNA helicase
MFDHLMDGVAERAVFLSATPGTPALFKDTHALANKLTLLKGGTPFPVQNRPVFMRPAGNLSKNTLERDLPKVAEYCRTIANFSAPGTRYDHVNQKGVIHTHNKRIMDAVLARLGKRGVPLSGGGPQRMETVERFKASKEPLILVSPSAYIGISFDEDMARWQIVAKAPYLFLGDPAVVHRKDTIKDWYSWQTTKNMIQSFGRAVRSPDDWAATYIIDESAVNHLKWNKAQVPSYIMEAIQW